MKPKQLLSSKISIVGLVVLLALLTNLKYQQWKSDSGVQKLKQDLEQQLSAQQKKNQELSDSLSYLNSDDFKEQAARQQLNLKRDGEVVYDFTQADQGPAPGQAQQVQTGNPQKWWKYFFGKS